MAKNSKKKRLSKDDILQICKMNISNALGEHNGELSQNRSENMDRYLGELHGNEISERSEAVTVEVAEQVDSILPGLVKTFAASEEAVTFEATRPEFEQQAEQETDYVNHVFFKENNGFLVLHNMFKDALIMKTGICKIYWDEKEEITKHEYKGLNEFQLAMLLDDPEVKLTSQEEIVLPLDVQLDQSGMYVPAQNVVQSVFNIEVTRTRKKGGVVVEPIQPEEFVIARNTKSIFPRDSVFCAHRPVKKASDLVAEGFDKDEVYRAAGFTLIGEEEKSARGAEEDSPEDTLETKDLSMRDVQVDECYIKMDVDGDGIAELVKVTIFGNKVQDIEDIDVIPFASVLCNIIPHKFYGLCPADQTKHYQLIKTTILRQLLDNMYQMNNKRVAAGENVNMDDLLNPRTGGVIRVENGSLPGNELMEFGTAPLGAESYNLLQYMDDLISARTGISDNMMGLNEGISGDTAHAVERIMTAAEQRVELVARIVAEGVKDIYWHIRTLLKKYQDFEKFVKLRGQWMAVNPKDWSDEFEINISVGFGQGEKAKQAGLLQQFVAEQKEAMQMGMNGTLASQSTLYKTYKQIGKLYGIDTSFYFIDPNSPEGQQAAQQNAQAAEQAKQEALANDPNRQLVQATMQIENLKRQIDQMKASIDAEQFNAELQFKYTELEQRLLEKMTDLELKYSKNVPGSAV